MKSTFKLVLLSAAASLALVGTANAQHHGGGGGFHGGGGGAHIAAFHGGGGYHGGYRGGYYGGGYRGWGGWGWGGALALGLTVATLPYAYSTYYYGGVPYYAADGVYYSPVDGGYQVVNPPQGLVQAPTQSAPTSAPAPVIYPRNNQTQQQQEADQQACNRWATSQPAAMNDGSVFQRSVAACMDARGYTLR